MSTPPAHFDLRPGEASLVRLSDLLTAKLDVPNFQRPYDWRLKQVNDLIGDLASCVDSPLFLGLIVLYRGPDDSYMIVDGQQRITSLLLLLGAKNEALSTLPSLRSDDNDFFRRLVTDPTFSLAATPETLSQRLLKNAYDCFAVATNNTAQAAKQTTCIAYVSPMLSGATSLFERINLRGREVSQFDLVKNRLIGWMAALDETEVKDTVKSITSGL